MDDVLTKVQDQSKSFESLAEKKRQFLIEKTELACDSIEFLLRQRVRAHINGYPSSGNAYLSLIEQKLSALRDVLLACYDYHPGSLYRLLNDQPDIVVWVVMSESFSCADIVPSLLVCAALPLISDVDLAQMLAQFCTLGDFDICLASLIDGKSDSSTRYFHYLVNRHTLSLDLLSHWQVNKVLLSHQVYPLLALGNQTQGKEWLDENFHYHDLLFERLVVADSAAPWLNEMIRHEPEAFEKLGASRYQYALSGVSAEGFDILASDAAEIFALTGETAWVPDIIANLETLSADEGHSWLMALMLVYGDALPVELDQLYVEMDWQQMLAHLKAWVDEQQHRRGENVRLGEALNVTQSLAVMTSHKIDAKFRLLIWQQLCLRANVYAHWSPLMPKHQQDDVLDKIQRLSDIEERFEVRRTNALVGR